MLIKFLATVIIDSSKGGLKNNLRELEDRYLDQIKEISDEEKVRKMNRLMVESAVNLAPILEYLGYKSKLGYEDILKIRKQLFTILDIFRFF